MRQSLGVIVARPPRNAEIVGVVVDLELSVDAAEATERIGEAAESLRAAGLGLMLLPPSVELKTRRRWWRRKRTTKEVHHE